MGGGGGGPQRKVGFWSWSVVYSGLPKLGVQLLGVPHVEQLPGGSTPVKELGLAVT